jgi:hypothetical protein
MRWIARLLFAAAPVMAVVSACGSTTTPLALLDEGDGPETRGNSVGCPPGSTLYGQSVGGFCCAGLVEGGACSTGDVCALDPSRAQGQPTCGQCPPGMTLYGAAVGGFCCNGALSPDGGSCSTTEVCALDPARAQGWPACNACPNGYRLYGHAGGGFCCGGDWDDAGYCASNQVCALDPARTQNLPLCTRCPMGSMLYGESAGGFCCEGTAANGSCSTGKICSLDNTRSQGYPECGVCPPGKPLYGVSAGGFCCNSALTSGGGCSAAACSLDRDRTQGIAVCEMDPCPSLGKGKRYGMNAGGFCCTGTVSADEQICQTGTICALHRGSAAGQTLCKPFRGTPDGWSGTMRVYNDTSQELNIRVFDNLDAVKHIGQTGRRCVMLPGWQTPACESWDKLPTIGSGGRMDIECKTSSCQVLVVVDKHIGQVFNAGTMQMQNATFYDGAYLVTDLPASGTSSWVYIGGSPGHWDFQAGTGHKYYLKATLPSGEYWKLPGPSGDMTGCTANDYTTIDCWVKGRGNGSAGDVFKNEWELRFDAVE